MNKRFLFVSSSGDSLPIAYRMQEEGADVSVYIHNPHYRQNYAGLLKNILGFQDFKAMPLGEDCTVIFDMVKPFETEFYKTDGAIVSLCGDEDEIVGKGIFGPLSKLMRNSGAKVIGMCPESERVELDRETGKILAQAIGLKVPPHASFDDLDRAIGYLGGAEKGKLHVLKPHGNDDLDLTYIERYGGELIDKLRTPGFIKRLEGLTFILEDFIPGVTMDEEVWFNGKSFKALNSTIEHKRFGAGDTGPNVGSSLNLVWMKDQSYVPWQKLKPTLIDWGYQGPVNATLQIDSVGQPWFLEWTIRLGFDAVFCLMELLRGSITNFFDNGFNVGLNDDRVATSARISLQPYPYEVQTLQEKYAKGVHISQSPEDAWWLDVRLGKRGMECVGADGILGVVTAVDDEPKESMRLVLEKIQKLKISGDLQYRTDGPELLQREWVSLSRYGWASMN